MFLILRNQSAQIELKQEAWDAFEGFLFLRNSDQDKYGSFIKGLQTQFSLGKDQYPKSLQKAIDALAMQRFDQRYFDKRKREADQKRQQRQAQQDEPPETPARSTSFAQTTPGGRPPRTTSGRPSNAICHCCGVQGHVANDCPEKGNIPKEEWFVKRAIGAYQDRQAQDQSQDDDSDSDDDSVQSTRSTRSDRSTPAASRRSATPNPRRAGRVTWQGLQFFNLQTASKPADPAYVLKQSTKPFKTAPTAPDYRLPDLKKVIILDTGSSIKGTFANPDLVTNVRPAKKPVGMSTNAGKSILDVQADVPEFGSVFFDSNHITNIFGFAGLVDQVDRITYDSDKEDAFHVHTKNGVTKFARTANNLYAYEPSPDYVKAIAQEKNLTPPPPDPEPTIEESLACIDPAFNFLMIPPKTYERNEFEFLFPIVEETMKDYTDREVKDAHMARSIVSRSRPSKPP